MKIVMLFDLVELIYIVITVGALGFIFSENRRAITEFGTILEEGWQRRILTAVIVAAPAVILHEFAHKFLALAYGFTATYSASLFGLAIGVVMKIIGLGFVFFVPGYVSISGVGSQMNFGLVALAGPLTNLALFLIFSAVIKYDLLPGHAQILHASRQINLWLFIFNMIPLPGFDGFKFFASLF